MQVYTYNEAGYYSGIHDCQKCPKTKNWLYPARYTDSPPPELIKNKMVRMVKNKWVQEDNYIGLKIWNKKTGFSSICKEFKIPAEFTKVEKPEFDYYKWSKTKWVIDEDLKREYDKNIIKGKLSALDNGITREEENIYNLMLLKGIILDSDILQATKDKIAEKEKLRVELNV